MGIGYSIYNFSMTNKPTKFSIYAWLVLAYTLAVILWGAYVRATGAGAGCGRHWPTCDGQVIPRPETVEMMVEFSHRLTSGLLGIFIIGLLVWAFRVYPPRHMVRLGAVLSSIFVITEGLLGAGLVLFELVAHNTSLARAISGGAHLVNTFILVAVITLTAWWGSGKRPFSFKNQGSVNWLVGGGVAGMLILGATGAMTALGDTLFPATSLQEGLQQDFSATAHFLVRLRVWHPVIAIGMGVYVVWASTAVYNLRPSPDTRRFSLAIKLLFGLQLAAGFLNVYLLVPVWMQMVHLLLADLVWIVFVLLGASALSLADKQLQTYQVENTPLPQSAP